MRRSPLACALICDAEILNSEFSILNSSVPPIYCTTTIGVRENATFSLPGLNKLTWQS
jgi:hypothetical protein